MTVAGNIGDATRSGATAGRPPAPRVGRLTGRRLYRDKAGAAESRTAVVWEKAHG